jgi:hypothetical protein
MTLYELTVKVRNYPKDYFYDINENEELVKDAAFIVDLDQAENYFDDFKPSRDFCEIKLTRCNEDGTESIIKSKQY